MSKRCLLGAVALFAAEVSFGAAKAPAGRATGIPVFPFRWAAWPRD